MIPKYIYTEMKQKAQQKLTIAREKLLEEYKEKMNQESQRYFKVEMDKGNLFMETKTTMDSYFRKEFEVHPYVRVVWRSKEAEDRLKKELNNLKSVKELKKKLEDLDKQYEDWVMDMHRRISNGETLTLPTFRV